MRVRTRGRDLFGWYKSRDVLGIRVASLATTYIPTRNIQKFCVEKSIWVIPTLGTTKVKSAGVIPDLYAFKFSLACPLTMDFAIREYHEPTQDVRPELSKP